MGTSVQLDFEPKPDAAGVPHKVSMLIDYRFVAAGQGDSDVSALRDLLNTITAMLDISDDVVGSVCGSFNAALRNRGRRAE